jgi:beta-lactam-binding protein with PASTA domain
VDECQDCGTPIPEGSDACPECGKPTDAEATAKMEGVAGAAAGAAAGAGAAGAGETAATAGAGEEGPGAGPPATPPAGAIRFALLDPSTGRFAAPDHGFHHKDQVSFIEAPGVALPGGITTTKTYYVHEAHADSFTVSQTEDGGVVLPTSPGEGYVREVAPAAKHAWKWILALAIVAIVGLLAVLFVEKGNAKVPAVLGQTEQQAAAAADKAGLNLVVAGTTFTTSYAPGTVAVQYPDEGQKVEKHSVLSVLLATDKRTVSVPNVVGQALYAAVNSLQKAGLVLAPVKTQQSTKPLGTVLSQEPVAGTNADVGTKVVLTVSLGEPGDTIQVPNLVGQPQDTALSILKALGLDNTVVQVNSSRTAGEVVAQSPAAGANVAPGSMVTLDVSKGGATTTAPATSSTTAPPATTTTAPPTTTTTAPPTTTTTAPVSTQVTIADFSFTPDTLTVNAGDTVTWVNNGPSDHTVVADDGTFQSPNLSTGQTYSNTFSTAGTFSYHCGIHASMTGTIVVQ